MTLLKDSSGRNVDVPSNFERIISLNPSITETICLLGLEDKLKGVSAFCRRPESVEKIRKIGSYSTYNENIVGEINPDIIMTISGYQEDLTRKLSEKFNVFQLELPSTPFGILDMIMRVGTIFDQRLASMELVHQLQGYMPESPVNKMKRAYLEIDLGGPVSFGSLSYITSTLNYFGLETPFDREKKEWLTPDYSFVESFDPEIMIFEGKMYRGTNIEETKNRIKDTPLGRTTAFRDSNIYCTPGKLDFFAHHGPSFFSQVMPWLREIMIKFNI